MPRAKAAKKHILVVEDDRALRYALTAMLQSAGFSISEAGDGVSALKAVQQKKFDVVLLDIGLPRMNGLEVLAEIQKKESPPRVIVMTANDTPDTVLRAIRQRAYQYIAKPAPPKEIVEIAERAASAPALPPIEVVSARPEWLELLVPCDLEAAERIQSFIEKLDTDLPPDVRESVGRAFRELLLNAVEWGGRLDPNRKVRIACLRTRRMVLYHIADPGTGFSPENLEHAAVSNEPGRPYGHIQVREQKGLRPGGFGLLMTRAIVDELIFNEAHNEVVFVKYLD